MLRTKDGLSVHGAKFTIGTEVSTPSRPPPGRIQVPRGPETFKSEYVINNGADGNEFKSTFDIFEDNADWVVDTFSICRWP
jgi:hypothetical protein